MPKLDPQLLRDLTHNSPTLAPLLSFTSDTIDTQDIPSLAEALKVNNTVYYLNINGIPIDDKGVDALAEVLTVNQTLTDIYLQRNQISTAGAQSIARALKKNTTALFLQLDDNNIGDEGAKALAEVLANSQSLTYLNLANNKINAEGASALAEALKTNKSLYTLDLSNNPIGAKGANALATALTTNNTLTVLYLLGNKLPPKAKAEINNITLRNQNLAEQLLAAVQKNKIPEVQRLLELGVPPCSYWAKPHALKGKQTILHIAVQKQYVQILQILLNQPSSLLLLRDRNEKRQTPFELAQELNHSGIIDAFSHFKQLNRNQEKRERSGSSSSVEAPPSKKIRILNPN